MKGEVAITGVRLTSILERGAFNLLNMPNHEIRLMGVIGSGDGCRLKSK